MTRAAAIEIESPETAPSVLRKAVLDYLLEHRLVEPVAVDRARLLSERTGAPIEQTLNRMGVLSDDGLVKAYAEVSGCKVWRPYDEPADVQGDGVQLTSEFLRERRVLPLGATEDRVVVAMCDPLDDETRSGVAFATGRTVEVLVASPADWRRAFDLVHAAPDADRALDERKLEVDLRTVSDVGSDSEGARFLATVLEAAIVRGASDVHFEPRRHDLRVRLRLDGQLSDYQIASTDLGPPIVSRIKVLANLDLGERRLPQDGRATFVVEGRPVEVRVSTLPSVFGEAAVLRILDRAGLEFDFDTLGYAGRERATLQRVVQAPHGIFLVTGPTGSGKTTTLYGLLNSLKAADKKILSIEDPIEFHFGHVVQTQVAPQIGLTFASALRAFLRQDPDIILVGEIRDSDTAAVAVQAAMTGHLVLASIHANDAVRVIPRLLDMGVAPYQLAAGLLGAAAQRLVRRLCVRCRRERAASPAEQAFAEAVGASQPPHTAFDAVGCEACGGLGYRGRTALVESFTCDEAMAAAITQGAGLEALRSQIVSQGAGSMGLDGCQKAAVGMTTFKEVMATLGT